MQTSIFLPPYRANEAYSSNTQPTCIALRAKWRRYARYAEALRRWRYLLLKWPSTAVWLECMAVLHILKEIASWTCCAPSSHSFMSLLDSGVSTFSPIPVYLPRESLSSHSPKVCDFHGHHSDRLSFLALLDLNLVDEG